MPGWVEVTEPWARPPRLSDPSVEPADERYTGLGIEVEGVEVGADDLDLDRARDLALDSSVVRDVVIGPIGLLARWSLLEGCDLSATRVVQLRETRLRDCRCTGTDLSEAELRDVVFERCLLNVANLRMARLERVAFLDCTLRDVDGYEVRLTDVTFDGSTVEDLDLRGASTTRVDLRGVAEPGLVGYARLDGCLIRDTQLPLLAPRLAAAIGLEIEQPEA